MKKAYLILLAAVALMTASCAQKLESGVRYPALELGDTTMVYHISNVIQNGNDVKPYFNFFDEVSLSLTYVDGQPSTLTFSEEGAPFKVTDIEYEGTLSSEWYIDSSKSPYEIKLKADDKVLCYIDRNRMVYFPFQLGAPSNKYEYRMVVNENK